MPSLTIALTVPSKSERRPRYADSFSSVDPDDLALREAFAEKFVAIALAGKPVVGAATHEVELDRLRRIALEVFDRRHGLTTAELDTERQRREANDAQKKASDELIKRREIAERDSRLAVDRLKIRIPRGRDEPVDSYKNRISTELLQINTARRQGGLGTNVPDAWLVE